MFVPSSIYDLVRMASSSATAATHTLLVGNLNARVHVKDLTALLYEMFSAYGDVIDVHVARGTNKRTGKPFRGTAFVSFKSLSQATSALRNLQKFVMLGKPIRIEYAQKRSDAVSVMQGKFRPRFRPEKKRGDGIHDDEQN